ncbi:MAG: DegT/DnrJ/EryC1/StrS family aminotransferase [Candidatus Moduliflexus flocculans]|nr:DegT/DnrJ/EryC1/StrS family aminotransferase [Candidatus Moduliflexus flocculans]
MSPPDQGGSEDAATVRTRLPAEYHHYSPGDAASSGAGGIGPAQRMGRRRSSLAGARAREIAIRSARGRGHHRPQALLGHACAARGSVIPLSHCCPVVFKAIKVGRLRSDVVHRCRPGHHCLSVAGPSERSARGWMHVIAVHMFGNLCDMPEILRDHGGPCPFVEDCAQSLGSFARWPEPAESFGDLAFFSLESGKCHRPSARASALSCAGPGSARARSQIRRKPLPAPSRADELTASPTTYLRSTLRSRRWMGPGRLEDMGRLQQDRRISRTSPPSPWDACSLRNLATLHRRLACDWMP